MDIDFGCPGCGKSYRLSTTLSGKRVRCKKCDTEFVIPGPSSATGATAKPQAADTPKAAPATPPVAPPPQVPTQPDRPNPPKVPVQPPPALSKPNLSPSPPARQVPPASSKVDKKAESAIAVSLTAEELAEIERASAPTPAPVAAPVQPRPQPPAPAPIAAVKEDLTFRGVLDEDEAPRTVAPSRPTTVKENLIPRGVFDDPPPPRPTTVKQNLVPRGVFDDDAADPMAYAVQPDPKAARRAEAEQRKKGKVRPSPVKKVLPPPNDRLLIGGIAFGSVSIVVMLVILPFTASWRQPRLGNSSAAPLTAESNAPQPDLVAENDAATDNGETAKPAAAQTEPAPVHEAAAVNAPAANVPRPELAAKPKPAAPTLTEKDKLNTADLVERCEPSVALIKGRLGSGTGFLVRPGVVATNAHVISNEPVINLEVRFPSAGAGKQGPFKPRLLHQDKARDLAFLEIDSDLPPLQVAEAYTFRKGEDVTVIGNPGVGGRLVLENAISRGVVSSKTNLNGQEYLQLGIAINPGNSGGPVFDGYGRVIGVVTLKTTRQEGIAFCVPAEDLGAAIKLVEGGGGNRGVGTVAEKSATAVARGERDLSYVWKPGETFVYELKGSADGVANDVEYEGQTIYRVKQVDDEGATMSCQGKMVIRSRPKPDNNGNVGPVTTKPDSFDIELKLDHKGNVISTTGSAPFLLLGDLSTLMYETFPDEFVNNWEENLSMTLTLTQQVPGSPQPPIGFNRPEIGHAIPRPSLHNRIGGNSRSRSRLGSRIQPPRPSLPLPSRPQPPQQPSAPQVNVTELPAQARATYALGAMKGDVVPIGKTYELTTDANVNNQPRFRYSARGTLDFDMKRGVPLSLTYRIEISESNANGSIRIPIEITSKLLTKGKARERALRPNVYPPTAMNSLSNDQLKVLALNLKSQDGNVRREACQALYDGSPSEQSRRREDIGNALEKLLNDRDSGIRSIAIRALGTWGDAQSARALLKRLDDQLFGAREELFEALGRMDPNSTAAEGVAAWLPKETGRAARSLRAMGSIAEAPLLKLVVRDNVSVQARAEACHILKEVGGSESVPVLEGIVKLKNLGEIGKIADESAKAIARRFPNDDEWKAIFRDIRSPDGGQRRQAGERLLNIDPASALAKRSDVARALEGLAGDVDGGVQSLACRALAIWGDAESRAFLIKRFDIPNLRPSRESIEALKNLGEPDEASAEAVGKAWKVDRGLVVETFRTMGTVAEPTLLKLLDAETDWGARNEICNLLGTLGTTASLNKLRPVAGGKTGDNGLVQGSAQNAIRQIDARKQGGTQLAPTIADLRSPDHQRVKEAVERLSVLKAKGDEPRKAEVARALDALLPDNDVFMRQALMRAILNWGDEKSAEALTARLGMKDANDWRDNLQTLVKLRPDEKTAEAAAQRLGEDSRFVAQALRPLGAKAEQAILAVVQADDKEPRIRNEACRALGELGTPAILPALKTLAGSAGNEQIARDAEDALNAILARASR